MIYTGSIVMMGQRQFTVKRIEIRDLKPVIILDMGRGTQISVYPDHWDEIEIIETNTPKKCKIN